MKKVQKIQLKIVIFTAVKNRCKLHGRVFVMSVRSYVSLVLLIAFLSFLNVTLFVSCFVRIDVHVLTHPIR